MHALQPWQFKSPKTAHHYTVRTVSTGAREEMDAIFSVRMRVFVVEQAVPAEEELDVYDVTSVHFMVEMGEASPGEVVATARLIDKGDGIAKIGRVAVLAEHRGRNVGFELMRYAEEYARTTGFSSLVLEAQCHAIPFYEKLGYIAEGPIFLDAGIEHRLMKRAI